MTAGLVIVGAGICGVSAAHAAREAGYDKPITLIGDDPEWPYERPPLSKWDEGAPPLRPIFPATYYEEAGITLMRGTKASVIDVPGRTVVLAGGQVMPFDKLLLTTGASAREISLKHLTDLKPHYLRDYQQAQRIASGMTKGTDTLIIGGGFIGLELAASLVARRCFVHVIEMQERILSRAVPAEIAERLQELHKRHGVIIHTGAEITSMKDGVATLSNGQSVRVGQIVVGVGSVPNLALAQTAGLDTDNGILVDAEFQTSGENIFAAGDCCAAPLNGVGVVRMESWQVAADQGRRAGQIIAGATPEPATPTWFWSDQFDHSLQVVGWPSAGAEYITRVVKDGGLICIALKDDGQIAHAAGLADGNAVGREIKLIQKIMQAGIAPTRQDLTDPQVTLKSILRKG